MQKHFFLNLFIGVTFLSALPTAQAATFDLNCVLSGSACTPVGFSFGTVTVSDITGGVSVVVDTATGGKYQDLFLNLNLIPTIFDSPALYSAGAFTLAPYTGGFDVGSSVSPSKGFDGDDMVAFQIFGTGFTADNFISWDTLGQVNLALHLQQVDCTSDGCVAGNGSIKVGGNWLPDPPDDDPGGDVPEPGTMLAVGIGLATMGIVRHQRGKR